MKKILLIITVAFTFQTTSNAQALLMLLFGDKLSTEKFQMGINAAVTGSDIAGIADAKFRYSWAFGAFGEVIGDKRTAVRSVFCRAPMAARFSPGAKPRRLSLRRWERARTSSSSMRWKARIRKPLCCTTTSRPTR